MSPAENFVRKWQYPDCSIVCTAFTGGRAAKVWPTEIISKSAVLIGQQIAERLAFPIENQLIPKKNKAHTELLRKNSYIFRTEGGKFVQAIKNSARLRGALRPCNDDGFTQ